MTPRQGEPAPTGATVVEQATGRCTGCGANPVRGTLVNEVETNSAPFWVNVGGLL